MPEILGAIKRAVDEGAPAGHFVVTGSSQEDLAAAGWPATGRLIRLQMYGLVESEIERRAAGPPFLERLADGALDALAAPDPAPDVRDYLARALRGGLPEAALASSERARRRWLASYLDQMVARDVALLGAVRDPVRLRRYLQALAANTAGTPTLSTLIDLAGIDRETAVAYDTLLEQLFVTERSRRGRRPHRPPPTPGTCTGCGPLSETGSPPAPCSTPVRGPSGSTTASWRCRSARSGRAAPCRRSRRRHRHDCLSAIAANSRLAHRPPSSRIDRGVSEPPSGQTLPTHGKRTLDGCPICWPHELKSPIQPVAP